MKFTRVVAVTIFCVSAALCIARPPKVVKVFPENGAVDVRPGLVKIRILFDQDMNRNGYSICGGGDNFPKFVSDPKWTSRRALVITARLKPNHDYSFGINSPSFKNFKSIRGEPAEVLVVQFRTKGLNEDSPDMSKSNGEVKEANQPAIKKLRAVIENAYSYKDIKGINWDKLFDQYNDALLKSSTPTDFAKNAGLLLSHAKDKHIWLKANGEHIATYRNLVTPNVDPSLLPGLIPNFKRLNSNVSMGRFADGIGYININSWSRREAQNFEQLYVALSKLADAPGLIIDVRSNGGGSEPLAQEFAGCFVDGPKLYAKHVTIHGASEFSQPSERILRPSEKRPKYRGPIAVLSGPVVMSSCEAFVLMMKQVADCKIIGEPTRGSSGNPKPHDLGNGVIVYLPSWKAMLPDGTCFEGKGIHPDIPIKVRPDQITAKDPVIEAALKELRRGR